MYHSTAFDGCQGHLEILNLESAMLSEEEKQREQSATEPTEAEPPAETEETLAESEESPAEAEATEVTEASTDESTTNSDGEVNE